MADQDLGLALGYCRVSSRRQFEEGHGLERYIQQLQHYGLNEEQIYYDIESGASDTRTGYNAVLNAVRGGKCKLLIVPCFDRLSRSVLGWEEAKAEFEKFEVEIVFLDGGKLDLTNPEGVMTSRLYALFASYERDKIVHRIKQGWKFLRSQRRAVHPPFGYRIEGDRHAINHAPYKDTDKSFFDVAREMIAAFFETQGLSPTIRVMSHRYGFKREGVRHQDFPRDVDGFKRWLSNPVLRGHTVYFPTKPEKKIVHYNTHPDERLLSEDEWRQIQIVLEHGRKLMSSSSKLKNPLAGLWFCGACGSALHVIGSGHSKKGKYLYCWGAYPRASRPQICQERGGPHTVKPEYVEGEVIKELVARAEIIAAIGSEPINQEDDTPEMQSIRGEIEQLKALRLLDLQDAIAARQAKLDELRGILASVAEDRQQREKLLSVFSDPSAWTDTAREVLTPLERQKIYRELVEKVTVLRGKIAITLKV